MAAAPNFLLSEEEPTEIFEHQKAIIKKHWAPVCDEAELSEVDRTLFWQAVFKSVFGEV